MWLNMRLLSNGENLRVIVFLLVLLPRLGREVVVAVRQLRTSSGVFIVLLYSCERINESIMKPCRKIDISKSAVSMRMTLYN